MATGTKKQKSILFRICILIFVIYTIVSLTSLQMKLIESRNELASVEEQVEQQKLKNQELLSLLQTGDEKDFIERAARDRLGYVYADEEVYTDIAGS
ncbi:MAG: FtsB family cell division protein [Candidatus Howiella sp.]|jgi:cell division protein FtsB